MEDKRPRSGTQTSASSRQVWNCLIISSKSPFRDHPAKVDTTKWEWAGTRSRLDHYFRLAIRLGSRLSARSGIGLRTTNVI